MYKEYVSVIGGANIDIIGTSYNKLNSNDSNPGKTILALGGVARNIAENLSLMNVKVEFITVLGGDSYAKEIINSCDNLNISLKYSLVLSEERTSTYLCVNNQLGEMQVAISDMSIYEHITPGYLESILTVINSGKACILDTNIPRESIEYILKNCTVPIFLDTVSTAKAEKIKNSISNLYALKPNLIETEILSDIQINNDKDLETAANIILKKGIKNLFISLGENGVYYTNGITSGKIPPIKTEIVNTTGAGDSFLAGIVWAYLKGYSLDKSTKAGLSASHICIKSNSTVSENMSEKNLVDVINNNWRD